MNDPVTDIARATAGRVATDRMPTLSQDVEVALLARDGSKRPEGYLVDPVSLGSLIVTIASLAWTIHRDLRNRTSTPAPDVLARTLRVQLRADGAADSPDRDRMIDIVVEETIRTGMPETE
jgi:hypothetical protein